MDDLRKYADRFICIQVNDRRQPRSWGDALIPRDGDFDLPAFFGARDSGGWYDLEIFSDNGLWRETYPNSLYLERAELPKRAVPGFRKEWDKRKAAVTQSGSSALNRSGFAGGHFCLSHAAMALSFCMAK